MTEELKTQAELLLGRLLEDVEKCSTREAHIRAMARANEAQHLLLGINQMYDSSTIVDE